MMSILCTDRVARALAKRVIVAALAMPALLPGLVFAADITPPSVPTTIQVEAGNVPFLVGHATGTQNYTCQLSSNGYAWTLVAPSATLFDDNANKIMTHYAGPTWQAKDGSTVVGERVDGVTVPGAIPWLLLRAASKAPGPDGDRLTRTTYIQRVKTTGGLAPTSGCEAAAVGAVRTVLYTADYYFYKAVGSD